MSPLKSLASYYRRSFYLIYHNGVRASNPFTSPLTGKSVLDQGRWYSTDHLHNSDQKAHLATEPENVGIVAGTPSSSQPSARSYLPAWVRWAFAYAMTLMVPLWSKNWNTLLRIEGEVEMVAEMVEDTAEVVEKIATVTEELSLELAENLPEDGKLKGVVLLVERVAKEAAEEAHLARDIIHKVDEVKQEMEMLLEPVMVPKKQVPIEKGH